jgi:hypothetical protein
MQSTKKKRWKMLRDLEDRMRKSTKYSIRIPEVEKRESADQFEAHRAGWGSNENLFKQEPWPDSGEQLRYRWVFLWKFNLHPASAIFQTRNPKSVSITNSRG